MNTFIRWEDADKESRQAMQLYAATGSGFFLFEAYCAMREAERLFYGGDLKQAAIDKVNEVGTPENWLAQLREVVLSDLDAIMTDVEKATKSTDYKQDAERLVTLNSALRIGQEKNPREAKAARDNTHVMELWLRTINDRHNDPRRGKASQNNLADKVAGAANCSRSKALKAWQEFVKRVPELENSIHSDLKQALSAGPENRGRVTK